MIRSVSQYLAHMEREYGEQTAFRWVDEADGVITRSFCEYSADVRRCACFLRAVLAGEKFPHVAVIAENSYHYVVSVMGAFLAGAVAVPMNGRERPELLHEQLAFADVCAVLAERDEPEFSSLAAQFGEKCFGISDYESWEAVENIFDSEDGDRLIMMMFTSGTTGGMKASTVSLHNFLSLLYHNIEVISSLRGIYGGLTAYLNLLPMYHVFSLSHVLKMGILGISVSLCNDLRYMYRDMRLLYSDFGGTVPMIVESWDKELRRGHREKLGALKMIYCGGAAIDREKFARFPENGIQVCYGYGMTETLAIGTLHYYTMTKKTDSIGPSLESSEMKIIDGELCIRSGMVTPGYYKNAKATEELLSDGWLHTGDLGRIDDEGYVYLTGRKKNLIILASGENVSPEELEALLLRDGAVKEAVVREKNGKICAEIFCAEEDSERVQSHVAQVNYALAMYKRITLVELRHEPFPKTASGKIKRSIENG